jgi:hypothetical protein
VFEDFSGFLFCLLCLNPEAEFCEEEQRLSLSQVVQERVVTRSSAILICDKKKSCAKEKHRIQTETETEVE